MKHFMKCFALLLLISCTGSKEINLIPLTEKSSSMSYRNHKTQEEVLFNNDDKEFAAVVEFLEKYKEGWGQPLGTFPTPQHTISFFGGGDLQFPLWVGPNWIGTRWEGQQYQHDVSEEEIKELIAIFEK